MQIPPIIERELRVALRKKRVVRNRFLFACAAVWITISLIFLWGFRSPLKSGQEVFLLLFRLGCVVAVAETLRVTADLFSSERRNNTLGLLFLSGLSVREVFASKLCGGAFMAICSVLTLLPCFAATILTGGVSMATFAGASCYLVSLLLFALAMSVLGSTLCEDESEARGVAVLIGAAVCLFAPAIYLILGFALTAGVGSGTWLLLSPAYGLVLTPESFKAAVLPDALANAALTAGWAVAALAASARIMNKAWRDQPCLFPKRGWLARVRVWMQGTPAWRAKMRGRWLEPNPFVWLAMRDRRPVMIARPLITAVILLWAFAVLAWPQNLFNIRGFLLVAVLIEVIIIWMAIHSAAKRFGEDRRQGAFELLLTTPLTAQQIVQGQRRAVAFQVKPLMRFLLAIILMLAIAGFCIRDWDWPAVVVYLIVWSTLLLWAKLLVETLIWDAMWISLNSGRPGYAVLKILLAPPMFVPLLMLGVNGLKFTGLGEFMVRFPTGTVGEILVVIPLLVIPMLFLAFSQQNRRREMQLNEELPAIVQEPAPEPSDPRFAKWDVRYRFPTGKQ